MNLHGNSFTRITLASLSWKFSVPFSENLILPLTCSPKSKSSCKSENFLLDWDYQEYIVITFAVAVSHQDFTPPRKKKQKKNFDELWRIRATSNRYEKRQHRNNNDRTRAATAAAAATMSTSSVAPVESGSGVGWKMLDGKTRVPEAATNPPPNRILYWNEK